MFFAESVMYLVWQTCIPDLCVCCVNLVVWQESFGVFIWQWKFIGCNSCGVWVCDWDKVWSYVRLYNGTVLSLESQVDCLMYLESIGFICWTCREWCYTFHTRIWCHSFFATLELHLLFLYCDAQQVDKIPCGGTQWVVHWYLCVCLCVSFCMWSDDAFMAL